MLKIFLFFAFKLLITTSYSFRRSVRDYSLACKNNLSIKGFDYERNYNVTLEKRFAPSIASRSELFFLQFPHRKWEISNENETQIGHKIIPDGVKRTSPSALLWDETLQNEIIVDKFSFKVDPKNLESALQSKGSLRAIQLDDARGSEQRCSIPVSTDSNIPGELLFDEKFVELLSTATRKVSEDGITTIVLEVDAEDFSGYIRPDNVNAQQEVIEPNAVSVTAVNAFDVQYSNESEITRGIYSGREASSLYRPISRTNAVTIDIPHTILLDSLLTIAVLAVMFRITAISEFYRRRTIDYILCIIELLNKHCHPRLVPLWSGPVKPAVSVIAATIYILINYVQRYQDHTRNSRLNFLKSKKYTKPS